jgi:hypothetical protein
VQGLTPNKFRIVAVEEEPLCTPHLIRGAASCWGVREGSGDVVLVPADTLVFDRVFEAVFVVIETRGAGFHFNEDHFLDVLRVHAFEDEEVDWRSDEFRLGGTEREVRKIGRELLGEHAAED